MHRRRSAPCTWNLCTNTKADHDGEGVAQSRGLFHDKRSLHVMKRGRFVSAIISCTPVKYTSPWTRDAMLTKRVLVTTRARRALLLFIKHRIPDSRAEIFILPSPPRPGPGE